MNADSPGVHNGWSGPTHFVAGPSRSGREPATGAAAGVQRSNQGLYDGHGWRTASASDGGKMGCVEVSATPGGVCLRDSQNRSGPELRFGNSDWVALIVSARGE
ncbi:DUF397 domain-containing protein [Nocardiopsis coralliicola]